MADLLADAVAAVLLQLQSRLLGDAAGRGSEDAPEPGAPEEPTATVEERVRTNVLRVLCEHFGEVTNVPAASAADPTAVMMDADASSTRWHLIACGQRVVLCETAGAWDVMSDDEEAATRVRRLVDMAQRSCTPAARSTAPAPQPQALPAPFLAEAVMHDEQLGE